MSTVDPTLMITAQQADQAALVDLARCLHDGGFAYRPHATAHAIEAKGQHSHHVNQWQLVPIKTTAGTYAHYFVTARDRDQVHNTLRALS